VFRADRAARARLDPDRDLECAVRAPGDYQMDLRRLRDGTIDAAYVGSTLAPEEVADEEGFSVLSWVGDHFQIPTVGIAVDPAHIPLDDPALQALVRANQRALQTIVEQPDLAVDYIASFLGRLTSEEAQQHYERYIGPYFTSDGRVDLNVAQHAVDGCQQPRHARTDPPARARDEGDPAALLNIRHAVLLGVLRVLGVPCADDRSSAPDIPPSPTRARRERHNSGRPPTPHRRGRLRGGKSIYHAMPRLRCLSALNWIKRFGGQY
jgi:hypothetical protein